MRVLLIGGNGFIGSHVQDRLLADGHVVRVLDRAPERFRSAAEGVETILGDLGDEALVSRALEGIEAVCHLAWTTLPQISNADPLYDIQSNVVNSVRLFGQCGRRGIGRMVFLSTGGTVYGEARAQPIPESHPTEPICSYGITKLAVEKYLALFQRMDGIETTVLRCSNAYGERQDPRSVQGAVSVFLARVARGVPIEVWGDGSVVRDYIHAGDIAAACARSLERPAEGAVVANIGSGTGTSLNELIEAIRSVTRRHFEVRFTPGRALDVSANVLDIRRAREQLGWEPRVGLSEGIERVWSWMLENPSVLDFR